MRPFFEMAVRAVHLDKPFDRVPPLVARFRDALTWYGDAVSDSGSAARVTKFVTAIERTVGTEDHDGYGSKVTDVVTKRAAILYSDSGKSLAECEAEMDELYECRSNLVHGTISPLDQSVSDEAHRADEISRLIILSALDFFTALGIDRSDMTAKVLRREYEALVERFSEESL
jgi:hypothetical protein